MKNFKREREKEKAPLARFQFALIIRNLSAQPLRGEPLRKRLAARAEFGATAPSL